MATFLKVKSFLFHLIEMIIEDLLLKFVMKVSHKCYIHLTEDLTAL